MSAPRTNLDRQKRRHAGPILGMIAVVIFALVLYFAYTTFIVVDGQTPGQTPGQTTTVPQAQAPAPATTEQAPAATDPAPAVTEPAPAPAE